MNVGKFIFNHKARGAGLFWVHLRCFSKRRLVFAKTMKLNVFLIGESGETVIARAGYKVVPN